MRRLGVKLVLLALVGLGVWMAWPRARVVGEPTFLPEALVAPTEGPAYMGVATCASMACHHANGPRGTPRSEYSTWAGQDKHAQAYGVLYSERSKAMVRNLYGDGKDVEPAQEQALCLKCHATGNGKEIKKGPRFSFVDGVGCESCHGAAEHYLSEHYRGGFPGLPDETKWEKYGLRRTKNLAERAHLCASCHVGDAAGKEVNHDLYAAGHPRLNFEFSAYHAQYPKHWDVASDKARNPGYEGRIWALGQVMGAKASLELLRDQAKRAQDAKNPAPWPEFAEYACFACHKNLKPDSPRQRAGYGDRVPGAMPMGSWPWWTAMRFAKFSQAKFDLTEWDTLRKEMERPNPNAAKVQASADTLLKSLDDWRRQVEQSPPLKLADVKALQADFLRDEPPADTLTWDEATQLYLAQEALRRARQDFEGRPASPEFLKGLRYLRQQLVDAFQIPGAPGQRVESPANFDPAKLTGPLRLLRNNLGDK